MLARAGLARLGRLDEATEVIDPLTVLPAPAQGALAVECRGDDAELAAALAALDDADTRTAVAAERALLGALEAGCTAPVGALARWPRATTASRSTCAAWWPRSTEQTRSASRRPVRRPRRRRWGAGSLPSCSTSAPRT